MRRYVTASYFIDVADRGRLLRIFDSPVTAPVAKIAADIYRSIQVTYQHALALSMIQ